MKLYLIRHPEPEIAPGVCYGRTDLGLRHPPQGCARRLSALLPARYRLFSSPLHRARALAQCLGTPELDDRLVEMNFGDWENRPFDEFRAQVDEWAKDPLGYCPPKGESGLEVAQRVLAFYEDKVRLSKDESVVLVGHSGPLRLLMAQLLGFDLNAMHALKLHFSKLSELHVHPTHITLHGLNR